MHNSCVNRLRYAYTYVHTYFCSTLYCKQFRYENENCTFSTNRKLSYFLLNFETNPHNPVPHNTARNHVLKIHIVHDRYYWANIGIHIKQNREQIEIEKMRMHLWGKNNNSGGET